MITNFKSINTLIAKLYRDLNINTELPEDSIVEWVAEALTIIGAYGQFIEISDCLTITNGKAKLPCNFYKLVDVRYKHHPIYWSTNTNASNYQDHNCRVRVCESGHCDGYTFYINDSYIITNINDHNDLEANLCMVYLGIKVDENGYPMIPDDPMYDKALAAYVTFMLDKIEWRKGKLADKIKNDSEADWLFYVNSARGSANMPNTAQLEGLKNLMMRLKPSLNEYRVGFKNLTKPENLNLR